jgi:hypothetical protein
VFFADDVNAFIWCNIIWSNELTLLGEDIIIWTWLSFMRMTQLRDIVLLMLAL